MNFASSRFALRAAVPTLGLFVTISCGDNASDFSGSGTAGSSSAGTTGTPGASGSASTAGATNTGGAVTTAGSGVGGGSAGQTGAAGSGMAGATTAGSGSGGAAGANNGGSSSGGSANAGTSNGGSSGSGGSGTAGTGGAATTEKFSFFVTSLVAVRRESGSQNGFGGKLGGLTGADEICTKIAEKSLAGSGAKGWRAFLSTTTVNAIDRVGTGPWYDRTGRLVANNVAGLLNTRPQGDSAIINDLPNEDGVPNRAGTGGGNDDNHDTITGSNTQGKYDGGSTCSDWTSTTGSGPRVGHSWPAQSGMSWMQAHNAGGCEPSVNLVQGGPGGGGGGIGALGGYGGFYCFALKP